MRFIYFFCISLCAVITVFASPKDSRPIAEQLMAAIAVNVDPVKVLRILSGFNNQEQKSLINSKAKLHTVVASHHPIMVHMSPKCLLKIELSFAQYYLLSHSQKLKMIEIMFDFVEQN